MKVWIAMLTLLLAVVGLCIWDYVHNTQVFTHMESESDQIYLSILNEEHSADLQTKIEDLNTYWTKEMDVLCISISRKDLQPISDFLQYLSTSMINENYEDALTYSRLLSYNIKGIKETNGIEFLNLL